MKTKVGIIGLGIIGSGIAECLLKKNYIVMVFNRTKEKTKSLFNRGAEVLNTPKELAEKVDVIILAVWDSKALKEVIIHENGIVNGIRKGQYIIDVSTQLPEVTRWEEALFNKKGINFIESPVHGSKKEAISGNLWALIGGKKAVFNKMKPILKDISQDQFYFGTCGNGSVAKLCGNLLVINIILSLFEAIVMAKKANLNLKNLSKAWGKADFRSPLIDGLLDSIKKRKFIPASFHLRTVLKDINLIKSFSETINLPLLVSAIPHEIVKIGLLKGLAEENGSALIKVFEDMYY